MIRRTYRLHFYFCKLKEKKSSQKEVLFTTIFLEENTRKNSKNLVGYTKKGIFLVTLNAAKDLTAVLLNAMKTGKPRLKIICCSD